MLFTSKFKFKKRELTDSPPDITATNDNWDTVENEFIRQETEIKAVKEQVENIDVSWEGTTGKPSTFPPSEHNHDDRYYTESEINTKLNGKANTSHIHTKSQISDFPTSLPANGGNADTVDGKHASDFVSVNGGTINGPIKVMSIGYESGQLRLVGNDSGFIVRNDGSHTYFMITAKGDPTGTWTEARPIMIDNTDGTCMINGVSVASEIKNLKALASQSPIKSIQRGVHGGDARNNITISISSVNPSKSIVILNSSVTDANDQYNYTPVLVSLSSTSFVISKSGYSSSSAQFSWQVIEFD